MRGIFITGTDTEIGKTHITCLAAQACSAQNLSCGVYKPACSGAVWDEDRGQYVWDDIERLAAATQHRYPTERICPQRFRAALAPPVAAHEEGRSVDRLLMTTGIDWWRDHVDLLLVEGVGGWLCPLTADGTIADFATELGFPVLVVAANRLGTINHTLLTLESIEQRGLNVAGIVMNCLSAEADASASSNVSLLKQYTSAPILGVVPFAPTGRLPIDDRSISIDWAVLLR